MKLNSKLAGSAALLAGGVLCANAQAFSFQSFGSTWTNTGSNYQVNELVDPSQPLTQTFNYQGDVTNVTSLVYSFTISGADHVAGAGYFTDDNLGLVDFNFEGSYSTTGLPEVAISDAATTYFVVSTERTLQGNISADLFSVGANYEYNTLNAVPEPAPLAAIGLGAIGFLARRKRK